MSNFLKPCCSWQKNTVLAQFFLRRQGQLLVSKNFAAQAAQKNEFLNEEESFRGTTSTEEIPETELDDEGHPFRKLLFMPSKDEGFKARRKPMDKTKLEIRPPRWNRMPVDQDWPSVWPTAASFKASAVPLPLRMGFVKKPRYKAPPGKHANLELMKIPNFLHLTPKAIQRHCEAIKQFCTPWPEGLSTDELCDQHFPLSITVSDYVHAGPSIRDPRSRIVTVETKVCDLKMTHHARDKLLRLVGDRYDPKTDLLTIVTDRCPARKQNKDYAFYLLTVLNRESWKVESWERSRVEVDVERYYWKGSPSERNLIDTMRRTRMALEKVMQNEAQDSEEAMEKRKEIDAFPDFTSKITSESSDKDIANLEEVGEHVKVWYKYRNEGETWDSIRDYGTSVRKLLGIPTIAESSEK